MIINIILGLLISYIVLLIICMFTIKTDSPEQYMGSNRYVFSKEGWYGETEFWDRKDKCYKIF